MLLCLKIQADTGEGEGASVLVLWNNPQLTDLSALNGLTELNERNILNVPEEILSEAV